MTNEYEYKHKHLVKLLDKAGSLGNLSKNLGIHKSTLRSLLEKPEAWPSEKTKRKIKPFIFGYLKVRQITRPYKRRAI